MPTHYCPTSGCGFAAHYTTKKPDVCPKCGKSATAAFKVVTAAPLEVVVVKEITRPVVPNRGPSAFIRAERVRPEAIPIESNSSLQPQQEVVLEDDFESDDADPDTVHARAEEIRASLDESLVRVVGLDQTTVRFGDWCGKPTQ